MDHLFSSPSAWWDKFAQLWEVIYQNAKVPSLWQRVRVALLTKGDHEWRPLCIASVMWRIGARHIVQALRPWLVTWLKGCRCWSFTSSSVFDREFSAAYIK